MKILSRSCSRDVRQRDVLEQRGCGGADQRRIDGVRNTVELILLPCLGIEDLNGLAVIVSRTGKIAVAFILRRDRGEGIVWIASARPVPSSKKEPFVAPVENLRNV